MYIPLFSLIIIMMCSIGAMSQTSGARVAVTEKPALTTAESGALEMAKAAVTAHGGDKFKQMTSFTVSGSVTVTASPTFVVPATFMIVISGDKYVFQLDNPFQLLKQIYDGRSRYSSGQELPPITSLGFPLLGKVGSEGYVVSIHGNAKKSKKGFRVTTPDGFYTDFVVNEKTKQISGYESSYEVNGRTVTTSVEIDEFQTVEGVVIPTKYSQRFDLGQVTAYAVFKTKDVRVNSPVADEVFAFPK